MPDTSEAIVQYFLSCNGEAFVCPQYQLYQYPGRRGNWACPDFVVIDYRRKELVVVEVSSHSNPSNLLERVRERQTRWFDPLKARLTEDGAGDVAGWNIRFLGFVRRESAAAYNAMFAEPDVHFHPLEDVAFPHLYWDERMKGLPGAVDGSR